ncbi:uncharacterized protein LOC128821376 [Vidua macroura]|uniref:uncharacterized protein LOC128821376 n=1 Tax=Vidua macroura TaxID=187451 RepID=UPI0023A8A50D|nr:uncharacterized protein LOC128821376 [Vidua macroura]
MAAARARPARGVSPGAARGLGRSRRHGNRLEGGAGRGSELPARAGPSHSTWHRTASRTSPGRDTAQLLWAICSTDRSPAQSRSSSSCSGSPCLSCPEEPRTGHSPPDTLISLGLSGGAGSSPWPAGNAVLMHPRIPLALLATGALLAQAPNRVPSTAGAVSAGAVRAFGRQRRTRSRIGVSAPTLGAAAQPGRAASVAHSQRAAVRFGWLRSSRSGAVLTGQLPPAAGRPHRRAARERHPAPLPAEEHGAGSTKFLVLKKLIAFQ